MARDQDNDDDDNDDDDNADHGGTYDADANEDKADGGGIMIRGIASGRLVISQ